MKLLIQNPKFWEIIMNVMFKRVGFSLIELLITLAIIGVLAAIAIPTYQNYMRKAHYSEIVLAAQPLKIDVVSCYAKTNDLSLCTPGKNGIPANVTNPQPNIAEIKTNEGVVTITPGNKHGLTAEDTYILTPTPDFGRLTWQISGGAVSKNYT
jgi:prepilin-type N-terminal cleavage/methylation domain-containing protein